MFGSKIRALRQTRALSIEELSELANIAPDSLSDIELDKRQPRGRTLRKIAVALRVKPEYFTSANSHNISGLSFLGEEVEYVDPNLAAISSLLLASKERCKNLHMRNIQTLPELKMLWEIDNNAYGDANVSFEVFKSWWMSYRRGLHGLFDEDQAIGAIGIWPVTEEWYESFSAGHQKECELEASTIRTAAAQSSQFWYITGIVLNADWKNSTAISILLREAAFQWALEADLLFPTILSALALSEHGEKLLGHYGFSLKIPGDMMKDGFPLYERSLNRQDLKLFLR